MPKHRRNPFGKKAFKFKLKRQTVFSIAMITLLLGSIITILSFTRQGSVLLALNDVLLNVFGWTSILIPFLLLVLALMFSARKMALNQPNVVLGGLLLMFSLAGLSRTGLVGRELWLNVSTMITSPGAWVVLVGGIVIGLLVLLNTSVDQALDMVENVLSVGKKIGTSTGKMLPNNPKPMKISGIDPSDKQAPKVISPPPISSSNPVRNELGTALVSNVPGAQDQIWHYPPMSILNESLGGKADRGDIKGNAAIIEKTLESFGIAARVVEVNLGPAVTQYAIEVGLGTKLSKVTALSNDLALALAAPTGQIRIEAPIPGRSLVGIELPNRSAEFVTLRKMLETDTMQKSKNKLQVALGLDVAGRPVSYELAKMPHVLIAGSTGSGKSVCVNAFIASLLFRASPNEVKLILVDPKRVELTLYNGIPHLLTPVIVEVEKVLSALKWAMSEMDRRYKLFAEVGVRNIEGYNEMSGFQALPYIVIFIDELADIMLFAPVEVEDAITRLAQMARATGIHLVLSTQRPSVDVITGLIKANIPSRISFAVSSLIDSRVIIDGPGAEKLLGKGDMLFIPPDQAKPTRIQGAFVSDSDVRKLIEYLKGQGIAPQYTEEVTSMPTNIKGKRVGLSGEGLEDRDNLFDDAIKVITQHEKASASLLQRRLSIGYARAARILDELEQAGIIGPGDGAKPRDVLYKSYEQYQASLQSPAE
jgi:DNA segregation ATPase FtsK/SpoIIIE, S-DNA-T family